MAQSSGRSTSTSSPSTRTGKIRTGRTARRLVVFGFFEEVLAQVNVPAVRRRLEAALEAELAAAEAAQKAQEAEAG